MERSHGAGQGHEGGRVTETRAPYDPDVWDLPPMPKEMTDVLEQLSQAEAKDYEQGMS